MRSLFLVLLMFLAACSAPRTMDPGVLGPVDARVGGGAESYQLAGGDKVRVIVFGEPTLTGEFIIGPDGVLSFPLVGAVEVKDKTTQQAAEQLRTMLASGYLRDPKVSMEVLTFRPYYILGEVNKPGQFPYASGLTVLNAVATAGGFSYRAERRVVYIRRAGANAEVPVRITPSLQVQPGDTLRIGERYF